LALILHVERGLFCNLGTEISLDDTKGEINS